MLFADATGFDVANIIIAVLVPLVSVMAAQQLAERHTLRSEAREAFVAMHTHVEELRSAVVQYLIWMEQGPNATALTDIHIAAFQTMTREETGTFCFASEKGGNGDILLCV